MSLKVSPEIVKECRALQQVGPDGKRYLEAASLLEWARKHPKSALHAQFEWNDEKAAEEWRLQQARMLICRVVVYIDRPEGDRIQFREYTSIEVNDHHVFVRTTDVLDDAEARRQLIHRLLVNALGELRNYPQLTELDHIRAQLQRLIDKYSDTLAEA